MISHKSDKTAVALSLADIHSAVGSAELGMRVQRDKLRAEFAVEIRDSRQVLRKAHYLATTNLIMRIFHFLNGSRNSVIRNFKLSDADLAVAETQALESCSDMRHYNDTIDTANKLRVILKQSVGKKTLTLNGKYLAFVKQFNGIAVEAAIAAQADEEAAPAGEQADAASLKQDTLPPTLSS